jgi:plastocyanin
MIQDRSVRKRTRSALAIAAIGLTTAMLARPASAESQIRRIEMSGMAFAPAQVTVRAGDTVEWDNGDPFAHTATSKDGGFDVSVSPGRKGDAVMTRPGTFNYVCRYHPNMEGRIVVKP